MFAITSCWGKVYDCNILDWRDFNGLLTAVIREARYLLCTKNPVSPQLHAISWRRMFSFDLNLPYRLLVLWSRGAPSFSLRNIPHVARTARASGHGHFFIFTRIVIFLLKRDKLWRHQLWGNYLHWNGGSRTLFYYPTILALLTLSKVSARFIIIRILFQYSWNNYFFQIINLSAEKHEHASIVGLRCCSG